MNIGLSDKHTELIIDTLRASGVSRAVVFGSRAKGNWRDNSDIDIAVFGDVNIGGLLTDLDELPTPYKFDVVNYETIIHQPLREHIDRSGVELYSRRM
ncbi:MAG: nucleotidyltransferase domain-containing protein [Gracilibacteraceae bacterium]|jgi:predicted nucleotidyltransferase|nr:nucleotidyltransferase domain-containing protein [Gracilibacteraceae bacterium]